MFVHGQSLSIGLFFFRGLRLIPADFNPERKAEREVGGERERERERKRPAPRRLQHSQAGDDVDGTEEARPRRRGASLSPSHVGGEDCEVPRGAGGAVDAAEEVREEATPLRRTRRGAHEDAAVEAPQEGLVDVAEPVRRRHHHHRLPLALPRWLRQRHCCCCCCCCWRRWRCLTRRLPKRG